MMLSVPSVMMKGGSRSVAIIAPFNKPMRPPASTTAATAAIVPQPLRIIRAPTTLVNAMLDPTERSIPPLTMIIVMPSAPTATITVCVKMVLKFA